jgi:hypothetical protein
MQKVMIYLVFAKRIMLLLETFMKRLPWKIEFKNNILFLLKQKSFRLAIYYKKPNKNAVFKEEVRKSQISILPKTSLLYLILVIDLSKDPMFSV